MCMLPSTPHSQQRAASLVLALPTSVPLRPAPPPPCQVAGEDDLRAGEPVSLVVQLEREMEGELRPVDAAR